MDTNIHKLQKNSDTCNDEEVSSVEWEFINMSEQEVDLIYRMHSLVGDRWALIAGRIPGRKAEEIERFWLMRQRKDGLLMQPKSITKHANSESQQPN